MRPKSLGHVLVAAACCALSCGEESAEREEPPEVAPPTLPPGTETPPPPPGTVDEGPSGPPQVVFVGRFETTDPAGPKASWPGARIITRFRGTKVSVTLSEFAEDWMDGAPSFWEVLVDHEPVNVLEMIPDNQPHVFELATDLPPGDHEVELYKRSEMQTGITQFLGFDLHGGRALPPPPRKPRHIEAMADSYGTGYGIEMLDAPNQDCPPPHHAGRYQNFKKAWPAVLGEMFDAEVEGTVYSGKGLTRGKWPTDVDGLIDYYPRANPNPAMQNSNPQLFDLKSWVPDAMFLSQGTVDHGISNFYSVYRDFVVNQLRARAPNAHIFLVVPGSIARQQWIDTVNGVAAERAAAGDTRVYPVIPNVETPEEMTGCGYHGSPAYHRRIASEIAAVVVAKTGWVPAPLP